ncbi:MULTISPECIES: type II toxin-antitoxin system VapB family antitoxin [Methylobacterium]|uniref:PSK operon transcription factor n=1 Tax=Methylobacterium thuringiense TaxID=1003091 RepID=A0ABQ4TNS5_9HYPH|nr:MULTISPECIES: type II toxin-antitoxin system VapB family antitoxin [Methylobacterium]TXN21331.1 PSK operon transcription factor [Methylobacterium sp. WL9]GJE55325.1 hypothetical protein EKPJFOCH_1815 [Methylobacterium thuringiense]
MTVRFEHDEIEALLTELETSTGLPREDVLLGALRMERVRLDEDRARRIAEGLRIDEEFRLRLNARPITDPRTPDEILGYDENGLPT